MLLRKLKSLFKKDKAPHDARSKRLADVVDSHMGSMVKTWNITHVTKTSLILFGILMVIIMSWSERNIKAFQAEHIAQIIINGDYTDSSMGTGYTIAKVFQQAIEDPKVTAIMLVVNSGGGSPVAGEQLYRAIKSYTDSAPMTERKPVYASIRALCASSCYYSIAPVDVIIANRTSLVGSIGVRMSVMNFKELGDKLGIEQRLLTSGEYKAMLDPFSDVDHQGEALVQKEIIAPLFEVFVSDVVAARKGKLSRDNDNLFSGFVWPGERAMELGFVDRLGTVLEVESELMRITGAKHVQVVNRPSFSLSQMLQSATDNVLARLVDTQIKTQF